MKIWKRERFPFIAYSAVTFVFLLLFCFPYAGNANSWKNLQKGDQTAQALFKQINQKKEEAGSHPFYKGTPKEANISSNSLKGETQKAANKDPAAQMIYESSDARPQVKIDPQKDPLLTGSEKVMGNPLEVIGGKGTQIMEVQQGEKTETVLCEEAGEDSSESCTRELTVKVIKAKVIKEKISTIRLTGCKKVYKSWHPSSCETLMYKLMAWRNGKYKDRSKGSYGRKIRIPLSYPLDVTAAFKSCLQEKPKCCERCNNPRNTIPKEVPVAQIQRVLIEKHPSGMPQITGTARYSSHNRLKGYDFSANIKITYEEDSHKVLPDEWSDNCSRLEERVDRGLCSYGSRVCTQGPQTRVIEGVPKFTQLANK